MNNLLSQSIVTTIWKVSTYDVWGNCDDGWEVNYVFESDTPLMVTLPLTAEKGSTPYVELPESIIREALNIPDDVSIEDNMGNSITYFPECAETGKPLGELVCVSHFDLCPVIQSDSLFPELS